MSENVTKSIDGSDQSPRDREAVLGVFAAVMRPLMRVALEYGISAAEISNIVRLAYIRSLETRLASQSRPLTDARLALVAGLSRSEVSALRIGATPQGTQGATRLDQITSLLSSWHTHPRFSGAYGIALDLDLETTPGSPRRSFAELIETACSGADRDAILDELVAVGSVEIVDGTTVRCRSRAYVLRGSEVTATRIERAARFLEAAAASFAHNLAQQGPAYFERTLVSDYPLSESTRDEFLKITTDRGEQFILELDTVLSKLVEMQPPVDGKRYGVSVYFFDEEASSSELHRHEPRPDRLRPRASTPEEIDVLAPRGQSS